ncbi:MAG TPA: glycosyltransferase family 2 protein [Solirubrobacteraceae bacterium]|nr:glycosyltransferase family 2 protein [Solirubrobacteraceae bacterium]
MSRIGNLLLGLPARPFSTGAPTMPGRARARWGARWSEHPRLLCALALLALGWMIAYLVWRVGWSRSGANPVLWCALAITELYGLWSLAMLTWFSWRAAGTERPPSSGAHSVDVYVCTYDEPVSVVRATLAGCAALAHEHTTYLLDDGRRPEMAALAQAWDAVYMTRPDNAHAKAGNINHALPRTSGDLVFVLDADHVPLPDALDATAGYFDDPRVAVVQTPHDFYNHDSIQHYEVGRHEQSVFFSVICPGKARHGAAFWCGSAALIRRRALLEVGGVATETIAEDFHTTIKLQRAGWTTRYHDEVLVQGLAPHDLAAYLLQRDRWARGNLAVLTTPESPLRARELTARQRLSYFASLFAYLAGPIRLATLGVLLATLWTGQLPLLASPLAIAALWLPATALAVAAGSALCRGYQRVSDSSHFELCTAEIHLRALRCVVRPGRTAFKVTPKEGIDLGGLDAVRQLRLVTAIAVLLAVGLVARLLDETAVNVLPDLRGIAVWVVPAIALVELRRVARTLAFVARRRQVRSEYRTPIEARAAVVTQDGAESQALGFVRDISPSGLRLDLPVRLEPGERALVAVSIPTIAGDAATVSLELEVAACRGEEGAWTIGARIVGASPQAERRVVEYCYVVAPARRLRGLEPLPRPEDVAAAIPIGLGA